MASSGLSCLPQAAIGRNQYEKDTTKEKKSGEGGN